MPRARWLAPSWGRCRVGVLSAVFWGALVLSLLVFLHEGGHYLAARAFGVRVTEFFLGMPCPLKLSRKSARHGTEVGVTPILLGGYTRICGMEADEDELAPRILGIVQREGRVRAADVAAEVGCDEDRAYGVLAMLSDWASIRPFYDPELGEKPSQSTYPEAFETLARDPDMLTEYDRGHDFTRPGSTKAGEPHVSELSDEELYQLDRKRTYKGVGFGPRVCMLLAGPLVNLVLAFLIVTISIMVMGVTVVSDSPTLAAVSEDGYAAAAGISGGDTIVAIDGAEVASWTEICDALDPLLASGTDFEVTFVHDGQTTTSLVDLPDGEEVALFGITAMVETYHPGLFEAASYALGYARQVGSFALKLITPSETIGVLEQSTSVVGISVMASEAAASGPIDLALFVGAISMSLGFMNLLPIPPLDGGKILIELIQLIVRRPLSTRAQNIVSYVGLAFFLFVFVFVLRNDFIRYVLG